MLNKLKELVIEEFGRYAVIELEDDILTIKRSRSKDVGGDSLTIDIKGGKDEGFKLTVYDEVSANYTTSTVETVDATMECVLIVTQKWEDMVHEINKFEEVLDHL